MSELSKQSICHRMSKGGENWKREACGRRRGWRQKKEAKAGIGESSDTKLELTK